MCHKKKLYNKRIQILSLERITNETITKSIKRFQETTDRKRDKREERQKAE